MLTSHWYSSAQTGTLQLRELVPVETCSLSSYITSLQMAERSNKCSPPSLENTRNYNFMKLVPIFKFPTINTASSRNTKCCFRTAKTESGQKVIPEVNIRFQKRTKPTAVRPECSPLLTTKHCFQHDREPVPPIPHTKNISHLFLYLPNDRFPIKFPIVTSYTCRITQYSYPRGQGAGTQGIQSSILGHVISGVFGFSLVIPRKCRGSTIASESP